MAKPKTKDPEALRLEWQKQQEQYSNEFAQLIAKSAASPEDKELLIIAFRSIFMRLRATVDPLERLRQIQTDPSVKNEISEIWTDLADSINNAREIIHCKLRAGLKK